MQTLKKTKKIVKTSVEKANEKWLKPKNEKKRDLKHGWNSSTQFSVINNRNFNPYE